LWCVLTFEFEQERPEEQSHPEFEGTVASRAQHTELTQYPKRRRLESSTVNQEKGTFESEVETAPDSFQCHPFLTTTLIATKPVEPSSLCFEGQEQYMNTSDCRIRYSWNCSSLLGLLGEGDIYLSSDQVWAYCQVDQSRVEELAVVGPPVLKEVLMSTQRGVVWKEERLQGKSMTACMCIQIPTEVMMERYGPRGYVYFTVPKHEAPPIVINKIHKDSRL
jgi:hypothetical protein